MQTHRSQHPVWIPAFSTLWPALFPSISRAVSMHLQFRTFMSSLDSFFSTTHSRQPTAKRFTIAFKKSYRETRKRTVSNLNMVVSRSTWLFFGLRIKCKLFSERSGVLSHPVHVSQGCHASYCTVSFCSRLMPVAWASWPHHCFIFSPLD